MNYYPFHLGDYAAHTAHLEPMEDLAYRRMLDLYYRTETALPDIDSLCRLIRMKDFRAEVSNVLAEFFVWDGAGWTHARCEAEIDRMQDKQAKAKASAAASVNARAANAQRTLNERSAKVELPTPTPTPKERTGEIVPAATASPPELENVVFAHQPTAAGLLCKAIKAAGVADVNPGHPDLLRLMAAQIPVETFTAAAALLAGRGKGRFALLLRTVEGQWNDAQEAGPVAEAKAADPWATRGGVEGIAKKLGMPRWDECCTFDVYLGRVRKAFEDEQRGSA